MWTWLTRGDEFQKSQPHTVHIEAHSGNENIGYKAVNYADAAADNMVRPNKFTYIAVTIHRNVAKTYAIVPYSPSLNVNNSSPPLPPWADKPTGTDDGPGPSTDSADHDPCA